MATRKFKGVCTAEVSYRVDNEGLVRDVEFSKGCDGNLQAVARLSEGRPAAELIDLLEGVVCGGKNTSCPAQFAQALKEEL